MPKQCSSNRFAWWAYSCLAFPSFRWISKASPLVIYYHTVSDNKIPHISNLYSFRNVSQFKNDVEMLLKFFRPISLQNVLDTIKGKQAPTKNAFLLTFDDGLKECYDIASSILRAKGIPATFFLCSAFLDNKELAYDHKKSLLVEILENREVSAVEGLAIRSALNRVGITQTHLTAAVLSVDYRSREVLDQIATVLGYDFSNYLKSVRPYLTSEQVEDLLKMGHAIGAHSIDHPRYADLCLSEQLHQTLSSVEFVKKKFHLSYGAFSFPHSDADVSTEFFSALFATGQVDVCFGNQGLLDDPVYRNIQRSSMEEIGVPAAGIVGRNLARRFFRMLTGRSVVQRL